MMASLKLFFFIYFRTTFMMTTTTKNVSDKNTEKKFHLREEKKLNFSRKFRHFVIWVDKLKNCRVRGKLLKLIKSRIIFNVYALDSSNLSKDNHKKMEKLTKNNVIIPSTLRKTWTKKKCAKLNFLNRHVSRSSTYFNL